MPELPEVETIRQGLSKYVLNTKIVDVQINLPKMALPDPAIVSTVLKDSSFSQIERQGKLLIFKLNEDRDRALFIHLKMTGQLIYRKGGEQIAGGHPWPSYNTKLPNKFSHIVLRFADGGVLYFNDQRQFGYIKITDTQGVTNERKKFGIEPMTAQFTRNNFHKLFQNRRTSIKAFLLNQVIISGIGNIYADEICYYSRLKPNRSVNTLNTTNINTLFDACQVILSTAVKKRGTTISDFVDSDGKQGNYADFLRAYGQNGKPCQRCGNILRKTKVAGRGTHFCTVCQK